MVPILAAFRLRGNPREPAAHAQIGLARRARRRLFGVNLQSHAGTVPCYGRLPAICRNICAQAGLPAASYTLAHSVIQNAEFGAIAIACAQ